MFNYDYFDAFITNTPAFPSEIKYHNDLINHVLKNEEDFLITNSLTEIEQNTVDPAIIATYNDYQLLKQFVLENAAMLKYDVYFKARKQKNQTVCLKYKETFDEQNAIQSLFFPFMVLKELLQAQALMPKFPYQAHITLKVGKETQSILEITFDHEKQALCFNLAIKCSTKEFYYHALGLGLGHGTYFDNMFFHSNLQKSLAYFDRKNNAVN